jgi:hypothetical protein
MSLTLEPVWNKPVKEYDRALDPLGMNRVNDRMIGELVQGFTSLTPRARYYAFYVWAINQIRKKNLAKNFPQFKSAFYDLERLFMLSCVAHEEIEPKKNHNDINGVTKGREIWMKNSDKIPLNFTYFGHRLGGYGQYYEGSIVNLGLIEQGEEDEYEKPTELGLQVIQHFDELATQSGILSYYGKPFIPKQRLKEIGEKICLCQLKEQKAEKEILQEIFFGFSGYNDKFSRLRQESFALILSIIDQANKQNYVIESQDFLDSVYFGEIGTTESSIKISIPSRLIEISKRWKIVKAHDNLSLVTESILQSFLGFLSSNLSRGRTLDEFFQFIFKEFNDEFAKLLNKPSENFADESIQKTISNVLIKNDISFDLNDIIQTSEKFDNSITTSSRLSEQLFIINLEELIQEKNPNPSKIITNGIILVLLTAFRFFWKLKTNEISTKWIRRLEKDDVGIFEFTSFVEGTIKRNMTMREFTQDFIRKYVIFQAESIYKDKIRSSTNPKCWFHKEGYNYIKDRDYSAKHRNIRFSSAISLLHDLDLVNSSENVLECTNSGLKMLERVLNS